LDDEITLPKVNLLSHGNNRHPKQKNNFFTEYKTSNLDLFKQILLFDLKFWKITKLFERNLDSFYVLLAE
jgi:hypothetical protein